MPAGDGLPCPAVSAVVLLELRMIPRPPEPNGPLARSRRRPVGGSVFTGSFILAGVACLAIYARQFRAELQRANREIASGRLGAARERLPRLSGRSRGRAEV